ncbi:hypothetical protein [Nonlabens marinus]|uniref:1,4-alpha-glucan (Glycogen) branching enzyme, GH-13-type n=1 Tax=Nonlabens marinus S1-08 TaxID=1454201 RepID=W8VQA9_9FLAO|nr:hypothetical protein [Nonlabens marinus]BAO55569.1 1,4-alpha-glucan (glycogen) branching enzyme, GH-13-type [Nonlabens marinus S1-08]
MLFYKDTRNGSYENLEVMVFLREMNEAVYPNYPDTQTIVEESTSFPKVSKFTSMTYTFTDNFMLPLSHDEVVYGKSSIIGRMPGDSWQKFANLRFLYTSMFTHLGGNLLMMGSEFGQHEEWKSMAA